MTAYDKVPVPRHELSIPEIQEGYEGLDVRIIANFRTHASGKVDRIWKAYEWDPHNVREWVPLFKCQKVYVKYTSVHIDTELRDQVLTGPRGNIHAWLLGTVCGMPAPSMDWRRVKYSPRGGFQYVDDNTEFTSSHYAVFCSEGLLVV